MTQQEENKEIEEKTSEEAETPVAAPSSDLAEKFVYDDDIVRKFVAATLLWGVVGMLVGVLIAVQLILPALNFDTAFCASLVRKE